MIKPGEYRYTIDLINTILYSSERVAYVLEDCKDIIKNKMTAQVSDYRYTEMLGGMKLSQKSFWDSANMYSIFTIQLLIDMSEYVKKQYGITLDQFLEEQYLEFDSYIYSKIPEFTKINIITHLGNKRATWSEINDYIDQIDTAKYSGVKMTWDFIGAKNDD